jgi:hypothetical protein
MPIDPHRQNAIAAAVGAYNEANLREPLPHIAGRLLIAMFPKGDVCQRSQFDLAGEGFSKNSLPGALRRLVKAGFQITAPGGWGARHHRLHLPRIQP